MASPTFPEPPPAVPPTSIERVDAAVDRVASNKDAWLAVDIPRRISYLRACLAGVADVAEAWVVDGSKRKGIPAGDVLEGEEWLAGPMTTMRNLRLLIEALEQGGAPRVPSIAKRPDGQEVVRVFPTGLQDKLMFGGLTADVWIQKGKPATQGRIYRERGGRKGKVALVLGAGNVSSIPPMDLLYKLFVEDEVVVLKMNPVNADCGPHLEKAFRSLIDDGFLAIVYGGADVGAHLSSHPKIDTLHVTGSDRTYDAIVWGGDPAEQARRKKSGEKKNDRPFSAELGCVTPVLIVPGPWSEAELTYQARHVAGMVAQNASFNCNAAKVLVTAEGWPQRADFLAKVEAELARTPARKAYYPGAQQRYDAFLSRYPKAKALGPKADGSVPWTVIPNVPPRADEYALRNEAFCGVLAEVSLPVKDARDFLAEATKFANDTCWGTLSCCMLIHPDTEAAHRNELDASIAALRFGGIGINAWPGLIYGLVVTTWGAYPGHTAEDIQSGTGVVHNSFLLDNPEKSVVKAPFVMKPTPAWFADNKNLRELGKKLAAFEKDAGWGKLVGVALAAFKGLARTRSLPVIGIPRPSPATLSLEPGEIVVVKEDEVSLRRPGFAMPLSGTLAVTNRALRFSTIGRIEHGILYGFPDLRDLLRGGTEIVVPLSDIVRVSSSKGILFHVLRVEHRGGTLEFHLGIRSPDPFVSALRAST